MATINYLLHESAVGYGIFEVVHQADSVGLRLNEVQESIADLSKFGKMIKLVNFSPWRLASKPGRSIGLISINSSCWFLC